MHQHRLGALVRKRRDGKYHGGVGVYDLGGVGKVGLAPQVEQQREGRLLCSLQRHLAWPVESELDALLVYQSLSWGVFKLSGMAAPLTRIASP